MWLFYAPEISGDTFLLPEDEAMHCTNVLRLKPGDAITLTDGKGFFYEAVIEIQNKKQVAGYIRNRRKEENGRNYRLHIAIAPTKNISRFEWFLEKATEIGIDEITPVITQNSERKAIRTDRLEKVIIAAMKQSLKAFKPGLNALASLNEFLDINHKDFNLYMAYCGAYHQQLLKSQYKTGSNALILVGPEGDFTPEEVERATRRGYRTISLGNSRLRTETAGIISCHSLYLLNQE